MVTSSGEENKGFEEDPLPPAYGNDFVPIVGLENYHQRKKSLDKEGGQVQIKHQGEARGQWDSPVEFLFSCISVSVGIGNVWRFPVVAYQNGGGAFLIPYFLVLIFIGRPMYFLELCLGQFASLTQVKIWRSVPLFKGVGYATMIATLFTLTYYCAILAISVFYLILSFQKNLPWANCDESWAGEGHCNGTEVVGLNKTTPEAFFELYVLKESPDISEGIGTPDWRLALCLLGCWIFVYFTIMKGVKSSGKVAYFTALFPYIVLIILLIRGVTLPGAWEGIKYFIEPQWDKLLEPSVWYAAVSQSFFSLNTVFGSLIMFASYNPFHHNIYRDALIVSMTDTFTSLLAGFTIFAILGNLAYTEDKHISTVVTGGASLAFVSYPDAIAKMGFVPQLFAVLFFAMLFTLGVGSTVSDAGAVAGIVCDRYPKAKRWIVTLVLCVFGCSMGLIYVTPGGQWMIDLIDYYAGSFVIYTMAIFEVVGIAWFYGVYNFIDDIEFMLGIKLGWYWKLCWALIIPFFLTVIVVYSLIVDGSLTYKEMPYPPAATVCGWLIVGVSALCLPVAAIHSMSQISAVSWKEKFLLSMKPKYNWGPSDPKIREEWKEFKARKRLEEGTATAFWNKVKESSKL